MRPDPRPSGGRGRSSEAESPATANSAVTVTVHVPGALRDYCDGASRLSIAAVDVAGALEELERRHPALHRNIRDETGAVRRHLNIFVNSANVRDGRGLDTALASGDVITILPAVSGG